MPITDRASFAVLLVTALLATSLARADDDPRAAEALRGGEFRVLATDADENPLPGAEVYVMQRLSDGKPDGDAGVTVAGPFKTGADGIAQVTGLPANRRGYSQTLYA